MLRDSAADLSDVLGGVPLDEFADWVGPALVTGRDLNWATCNVPSIVVAAALPD
jgi:hypothetical protein